MYLYKKEKYKVLEGSKTNAVLCTCWFDPFIVESKFPQIKKYFSITGTLYSKEGVSILLRNLALNPHIRYLFVWSNTPLSNTPFGIAGRALLDAVWSGNFDPNDIHKEIDREIIKKITDNVELIHFKNESFEQSLSMADSFDKKNINEYMDPISFADPVRDESVPFPSEKVGWLVREKSIYRAWLNVVEKVMRYGSIKLTEYGNNQRELQSINWIIDNESFPNIYLPDLDSKLMQIIGLNEESLAKYKESLLDSKIPNGVAYTYGSRLRSYFDIDQIDILINQFKKANITRRAVAITYIPQIDTTHSSPPCLIFVQLLIDVDNKLNLFALFRSHDIFKAGLPNAFGLLSLHDYICQNLQLKRGTLSIQDISSHIYEEDWQNANDLLKCQKWSDIKIQYNENTETDPRGIVRISLMNKKINLEIVNSNGVLVFEDTSESARALIMRISKLELLSIPAHLADICIELVKAEIALQMDLEYVQDRLLKFGTATIK